MSNGKNSKLKLVKAIDFQTVTFFDAKLERQVIVLYTLGEDGVLREYSNNKWNPYPIVEDK